MSWFSVLKASFPYVRDIATVAIPAFTSRSEKNTSESTADLEIDSVVQTQIKELQAASVANSESIKALASQLEEMMHALEDSASQLQKRTAKLIVLLYSSAGMAIVALCVAIWTLAR